MAAVAKTPRGLDEASHIGGPMPGGIEADKASRLRIVCHYCKELLLVDLSILVQIKFVYHCLPDGDRTLLAWLKRDPMDGIS